jgi:hypothetical protein
MRIDHPRLGELYSYWDRKRGGAPAPARADIDPVEVPRLLGNILICEVQDAPRDFIFRLFGTALVEAVGRDLTGERFSTLFPKSVAPDIVREYKAVAENFVPVISRKDAHWANKSHIRYERLLLPLSDDGKNVNRILGGAYQIF